MSWGRRVGYSRAYLYLGLQLLACPLLLENQWPAMLLRLCSNSDDPCCVRAAAHPRDRRAAIHHTCSTAFHIDTSIFESRYHNEVTGCSAYDPQVLAGDRGIRVFTRLLCLSPQDRASLSRACYFQGTLSCGMVLDHSTNAVAVIGYARGACLAVSRWSARVTRKGYWTALCLRRPQAVLECGQGMERNVRRLASEEREIGRKGPRNIEAEPETDQEGEASACRSSHGAGPGARAAGD